MTEPNDVLDRNACEEFKPGLRRRLGLGVIKVINNLATFEPDRNPDKAPPLAVDNAFSQERIGTGIVVTVGACAVNFVVERMTGINPVLEVLTNLSHE